MAETTERSALGAIPYTYWSVKPDQVEAISGGVIEEAFLNVYVNGQELATLMCSPMDQEALALGFLFNENVVQSLDEVALIRPNMARTTVDIFLKQANFVPPRRMILTSGCGGISFREMIDSYPPLETNFETTSDVIFDRMRDLQEAAQLYQQVRGVHTSLLGTDAAFLLSAEDVGRHNTIDKLAGKALLAGIPTRDCILMTSGWISSEMLGKARQMGVPLVGSRTAPTSITIQLAQAWNICVVGYIRQGNMRVYTHPARLGLPELR